MTSDRRLRALALYDAMDYPPTIPELELMSEPGEIEYPLVEKHGRVVFHDRESLIDEHERREYFFARKIRRAKKIARFLAGINGVRFVALCNTTALAHARDEGDLDLFVITKKGVISQVRGLAVARFLLTRPGVVQSEKDAVCLSYFIDDSALDLTAHQLKAERLVSGQEQYNDPYFRGWFLSLLPLFDDGVTQDFWDANAEIRKTHPHAQPWMISEDLRVNRPWWRIPTGKILEHFACVLQEKMLSKRLKNMRNKDSRVIVNEHVLKFHVDDGREMYRERYRQTCKKYGMAP